MLGVASAFTLFVALHSIPAMPAIKSRIVWTIGRPVYLAVYSLVSLLALVWLFYEALNTEYIELWETAAWQVHVALVTSPLGFFFVLVGLTSPNPFSVTMRRDGDAAGAIVRLTRHPVLIGFFLWSAGHVFSNGDVRSLVLFGGFAAFSLGGIAMAERRSRARLGPMWTRLSAGTSVVPAVGLFRARRLPSLDIPMVASALTAMLLIVWLLHGGHAALLGVDPLVTLQALQ